MPNTPLDCTWPYCEPSRLALSTCSRPLPDIHLPPDRPPRFSTGDHAALHLSLFKRSFGRRLLRFAGGFRASDGAERRCRQTRITGDYRNRSPPRPFRVSGAFRPVINIATDRVPLGSSGSVGKRGWKWCGVKGPQGWRGESTSRTGGAAKINSSYTSRHHCRPKDII